MEYPKVSIIILNHNGFKDTEPCLISLNKLAYKNFDVYLVENGSSDDGLIKIKKFLKENKLRYSLELIESSRNLGFAGGNNLGIKKAMKKTPNYVLLLNNDIDIESDFLDKLIQAGETNYKELPTYRQKIIKNPRVGILGPKIMYYSEPQKIWFGGGKFSWFFGGQHLSFNEEDKDADHRISPPVIVDWITGCCLLIKSEIIKKFGLLSEEYFLYYEDTDFNLRIRNKGFQCLYVPEAKIYHKVSSFTKTLGNPTIYYYHFRNALYLAHKNAPFFLRNLVIHFWAGYKFLKQLFKLFIPSKRESAKAIIKGIKDFYSGKTGKIS